MNTLKTSFTNLSLDTTSNYKQLFLYPKPAQEDQTDTQYRFRLLWFENNSVGRTFPFIAMNVHQFWGKTDEGKNVLIKEVVCPSSDHLRHVNKKTNNAFIECPICKYAGKLYDEYKASGWTATELRKQYRAFTRKFVAYIPVYVVNDPVNPANNNTFKILVTYNKDDYSSFFALTEKTLNATKYNYNIFNGIRGVDYCVEFGNVTEKSGWNRFGIVNQSFSTSPYDIPSISPENIQSFNFDEVCFKLPVVEELYDFYNTYCNVDSFSSSFSSFSSSSFSSSSEDVQLNTNITATKVEQAEQAKIVNTSSSEVGIHNSSNNVNTDTVTSYSPNPNAVVESKQVPEQVAVEQQKEQPRVQEVKKEKTTPEPVPVSANDIVDTIQDLDIDALLAEM